MVYMIVGGQWGSEGKGLFAGYMARRMGADGVVCQFGPNAGHTWVEGDKPIIFKSLPVASIAPSVKQIFLGPGSVINPDILQKEVSELQPYLRERDKYIFVHEAAAILEPGDAEAERGQFGVSHIASTMQGTSEAMIRKIKRKHGYPAAQALKHIDRVIVIKHRQYQTRIREVAILQIEGSQGMDLSINSGFSYPYVTSRDCTPAQVLADCGIHPYDLAHIYACIRTYPIRVGNIYTVSGEMVGESGPCYADQREISWADIGQKEELTTVTKRVRRVFTFSMMQMRKLVEDVRPDRVFLNFANYMKQEELRQLINNIHKMTGSNTIQWVGYGPKDSDIKDWDWTQGNKIIPPEYGE